VSDLFSERN